jgi:hypothetical protein
MVFILPSSGQIFKGADLLKPLQFFLGGLGQKLAAPAFANQAIDLIDQRFGDDDVSSSRAH